MSAPGLPTDGTINPERLTHAWPAPWCQHPNGTSSTGDVLLFRKVLEIQTPPERYLLHVSADQRYRFFVNGESVSWGPARGDLQHWRFETVDIAPLLRPGRNVLAARVHFLPGDTAPLAQMSSGRAGLVVCGDSDAEAEANTPKGWKVWREEAYTFSNKEAAALWTYCVIGPSEVFDATRHPWEWQSADFDDSDWPEAVFLKAGAPFGLSNSETFWWMVPRPIPAMEETPQRFGRVVRAEGVSVPEGWPATSDLALTVPPHTQATLLIDQGFETCAFPRLRVSGGAGATIRLSYAEGLHEADSRPDKHAKGNRNETEGKVLRGYGDTWHPDGAANRVLDTLWWRTFRYLELVLETGDDPLTLEDLEGIYTGYPFTERARFEAPEMPELTEMVRIGWRTARLCAHETYMDCPYYEQLQYAGDTRIQCFVSLYTSGDARLFRNALQQLDDSRLAFGLTQSRYPSRIPQIISPFSLWWVCMVHDYWQHVPGEDDFLRSLLPGIRSVLHWYTERLRPDGLLGPLDWWNFTDWCPEWPEGAAPGAGEGGSAIITLQFVLALEAAQDLFTHFGQHDDARQSARLRRQTTQAVKTLCVDSRLHRVADTPAHQTFSQHAIALALLVPGMIPTAERRRAFAERMLSDTTLTQATFYFRFYVYRAMIAAGLGDLYLGAPLDPWRGMLNQGLSTWAENPEPTRSDCHAWSASPNYDFLATVLGVGSGAPGWATVAIRPHLGPLTRASGVIPHPNGEIVVSYTRPDDTILEAEITLPPGTQGVLAWGGHTPALSEGTQTLRLTEGGKARQA